jgi:hypothetical protein
LLDSTVEAFYFHELVVVGDVAQVLFAVTSAGIWNEHIIFVYQFHSWVVPNVHRLCNVCIPLPTPVGWDVVDEAPSLVVWLAQHIGRHWGSSGMDAVHLPALRSLWGLQGFHDP